MIFVTANQATATKRRVYFQLVDATDGFTPETGEASGQPQISTDGAAWTDTGIGTLVSIGNGRYYAELTQTAVQTAGVVIETRYQSANTAECPGDSVQVVAIDLNNADSLGLGNLNTTISSRSTLAASDILATPANKLATDGSGNVSLPAAYNAAKTAAQAGDKMDLVNAPNATAVTAIQSGLATSSNVSTAETNIKNYGDTHWQTATGFATPTNVISAVSSIESYGDSNWATATGFATSTDVSNARDHIENHGDNNWATANITGLATATDVDDAKDAIVLHGDNNWTGGGGGSYPSVNDIAAGILATPQNKLATDGSGNVSIAAGTVSAIQSGLATSANVSTVETNIKNYGDGKWSTADLTGLATSTNVDDAKDDIINHGDSNWTGGGGGNPVLNELATMIEDVNGARFTEHALEKSPSGIDNFAGAISWTATIQDTGSNPLPSVLVYLTALNSSTAPRTKQQYTDSNGNVTFMLQAGDYYMWRYRADLSFPNPVQVTVS